MNDHRNVRILIVDDNESIHEDFEKILQPKPMPGDELLALESSLFGDDEPLQDDRESYELHHAFSGLESVKMVRQALRQGRPYAVVIMDMRMPPGIDGLEAASRILHEDPRINTIFCTAYSDHSMDEIEVVISDRTEWYYMKKPFDREKITEKVREFVDKWNQQKHDQDSRPRSQEEQGRLVARTLLTLCSQLAIPAATVDQSIKTFISQQIQDMSPDTVPVLKRAEENARILHQVIHNIQLLGRLETDEVVSTPSRVSMSEAIATAVELKRPDAALRRLELRTQDSPPHALVWADQVLLGQIIQNLIEFELHYAKPGHSLCIQSVPEDGHVKVGIIHSATVDATRYRSRNLRFIFTDPESYSMTNPSLGLVIARRLIEQLNGTVKFETCASSGGSGQTDWWFSMPIVR